MMNCTSSFMDMVAAYKQELGDAFPVADPRSVLQVLLECTKQDVTTQKSIEQATGLTQPHVAKLIAAMVQRGWLMTSDRDPKTNMKTVQVAPAGIRVLSDFERACRKPIEQAAKALAAKAKAAKK